MTAFHFSALFTAFLALFLNVHTVGAQSPFAGPLHGALPNRIEYSRSPYLVDADIYVLPGATVVIDPGVILLFKNFTGLHVQGTLLANGAKRQPIVFSSVRDTLYNPESESKAAPYDWNGIDMYESAKGSRFRHCKVGFSVYGIKSQTEILGLESVTFMRNGKADFEVEGEKLDVAAGEPYSFGTSVKVSREPVPESETRSRRPGVHVLRYMGIAVAVGGGAMGLWSHRQFIDSDQRFNSINAATVEDKKKFTTADWEDAKSARRKDLIVALTGYGLGILGAIGFGVSFAF